MTDSPAKNPPKPDSLPTVEPPTAGFILQLFLIPLLIVSIVIVLWLVFSWLAHAGQNDPQVVLKDLQRLGSNSFQRAHELAGMLQEQSEEGEKRRNDPKFAGEVAQAILQDIEVYPGDITDSHAKVRMFLCGALGEFEVPEAIPPLVQVLQHTGLEKSSGGEPELFHPDTKQREVRRVTNNVQVRIGAAQSIAKLAEKLDKNLDAKVYEMPDVVPALIEASRRSEQTDAADQVAGEEREKEDPRTKSTYRPHAELRAVCAYALGVVGGDEATQRLAQIAENDSYPNARYNAATGLARRGDERATETLLEMLDPENKEPVENEWHSAEKEQQLANVLKAGLQATLKMVEARPAADHSQLRAAVENLSQADLSKIMYDEKDFQGQVKQKQLLSSATQRRIKLSATELLRIIDGQPKEKAEALAP